MPLRKLDDGSKGDDAEGHGLSKGGFDDGSETDDAEGHIARPGRLDEGSQTDDAEGHGAWTGGKRIQPTKAAMSDADADDVHGRGRRVPPLVGDAEGHGLPSSVLAREGRGGSPARPVESEIDDVEGHVNWRPLDRGSDQ